MHEMDKRLILEEIEEAFKDVPKPRPLNIVYDNSNVHFDCSQLRRRLQEIDWHEVSHNIGRHFTDELSFFTPEAFKYFLPGYMTACIENYVESDVLVDNLTHRLKPSSTDDEYWSKYFCKFVESISENQAVVIHKFLEFLLHNWPEDYQHEDDDIHAVIEYWQNRLNPSS